MAGTTGVLDLGSARVDVTSGAVNSQTNSGSVWSYGTWPEDRYDAATSTAEDAVDNTAHLAVEDQNLYEGLMFMNTTGNVTIQISLDGTTYIAADHPFIDMGVAARTIVTGTSAATGPYLMNTPCKAFKFLNEGAVQSTVTYAQVGKVGI